MVTMEMMYQVALEYARSTLHTNGEPELAVELNVLLHLISTFERECGCEWTWVAVDAEVASG